MEIRDSKIGLHFRHLIIHITATHVLRKLWAISLRTYSLLYFLCCQSPRIIKEKSLNKNLFLPIGVSLLSHQTVAMNSTSASSMSTPERYFLVGWTSIVLFSCILGNTVILLATTRYKAIRLDKTSVVLIKSIAICDLAMGIFSVHTSLASLLYGGWPYGTVSCYVSHYLKVPTFICTVLLICGLHLSKLYNLLYPFKALGRTSKQGKMISAVILVLSTCPSILQLAVDWRDVDFDYRSFICLYRHSAPLWKILSPMIVGLFVFLPNLIVFGTSVALLRIAKKVKGRVKQGIWTTLYVAFVHFSVNGPITFHILVIQNLSHILSAEVIIFYDNNLFRTVSFFASSSCFLNFLIYYRSVRSFNFFVRKSLQKISIFVNSPSRINELM